MCPQNKKRYPETYHRNNHRKITEIERTRLANGIKIITEKTNRVESFSLGICASAGSREDADGYNGTAHFLEHILFRLSKHGSTKRLNGKFESIGAYVNAYTAKEFTYFYARALQPNFKKAFNLLSDIILPQEFRDKEIDAERKVIIEEIKLYKDDPEELIFDTAEEIIFGEHPLAKPIAGDIQSVMSIDKEIIEAYYSEFYHPNNIVISAVGNIEHQRIVDFADKNFGNLKYKVNQKQRLKPNNHIPQNHQLRLPIQQAYLLLARRINGINTSDRYPLISLNELFCDGMSSRLQDKIRDRYGLVYSLDSDLYFYSDEGIYSISAVSDKKSIERVQEIIFNEMDKLLKYSIFNSELQRAKEQLKSRTLIDNEDLTSKMKSLIKSELYYNEPEKPEDAIQKIDSITIEDIQTAINSYMIPNEWSIISIIPK